jgi:MFS family permease
VVGLSGLYGLRLLGLYLVLPVLSIYAGTLAGSTPLLIGLSLGVYGFAQALLQIPFGLWSDRYGRRRAIVVGLLLFALGSVIAAQAHSILWLIVGRFFQGAGAVASALVALMADLSGPRYRTRAMGAVGVSVGLAFAAGMVAGPPVSARLGVPALFWLTAVLSGLGALYVAVAVPKTSGWHHDEEVEWTRGQTRDVLHQPALVRLDGGIFVLHLLVTCAFVVGPTYLERYLPVEQHGRVYAPVVLSGVPLLALSAFFADRRGRLKEAVVVGSVLLVAGAILLMNAHRGVGWCVGLTASLVAAIAIAEPAMPALLTHLIAPRLRGTAAGIFHTCQFAGSFVGGMAGGAMLKHPQVVGPILVGLCVLWVIASWGLPAVRRPAAS